jgi:thymidine kinase|tara:strand:- start:323 stop:880 length:558 start_codon:yes stop_codon:yes gene_type:complete
MMKNRFIIFCGPMFGGKTSKLLSAIDRYSYQKRTILAFKPCVDDRYDNNSIVTHTGGNVAAAIVTDGDDILASVEIFTDPIVIAVDEAFMIPGSGKALVELYRRGHTVLISSLQLSSSGKAYDEIAQMMPYATKIEICPAVCTVCAADAYYTQKVGGRQDHEIEVGGADLYQPRCFKHFNVNEFK